MDLFISLPAYEQKHRYKYLAVYHALKEAIYTGRLLHGTRMPSTREFAKRHGLSRGIISQVYDMLAADGYLVTRQGSGTFVYFPQVAHPDPVTVPTRHIHLSPWAMRLPEIEQTQAPLRPLLVNFATLVPNIAEFPFSEWSKTLRDGISRLDYFVQQKEVPISGLPELREAISVHLNRTRGMKTSMEDVFIVNGSIHAMALLGQVLISPGDLVVVENPTYRRTIDVVRAAGGTPVPIRYSPQGMIFEDWNSRLMFVTPTYQYPTGRVMRLKERLEIIDWASRHDAFIIEDDIDSDFRRQGRPREPLKVLDNDTRVIYTGTFAYTLLKSLKIGYVVLPPDLRIPFQRAKQLFEPFATSIGEQMAVAHFMKAGLYEKHLRKTRQIYADRYARFWEIVAQPLSQLFEWEISDNSLRMFGWWKGHAQTFDSFRTQCAAEGVIWEDASIYFLEDVRLGASVRPGAILNFSHLEETGMHQAITIMLRVATQLHLL